MGEVVEDVMCEDEVCRFLKACDFTQKIMWLVLKSFFPRLIFFPIVKPDFIFSG
jgi:hypothetical protein